MATSSLPHIFLSLRATQNALLSCDAALSEPTSLLQPTSSFNLITQHCNRVAANTLRWMPSHGHAHFVAALAAHQLGDTHGRAIHVENSQKNAPFEAWLAERRFALAMNQIDISDRDTPGLRADIITLLSTQSGAELLAAYYLRKPTSRSVLGSVAAGAVAEDRVRFLNQLWQKQAKT